MIYVPDTGGAFSTWKNQEQFAYRGHVLELCYQTEPPHGDFLYSLTLLKDQAKYRLPLWIFGRSLFFFPPSFLLAESIQISNFSNLKSVIVELSGTRYVRLDSWYQNPQLTEQGLLLSRFCDSAPLLLTPSTPLIWENFHYEGAPV